MVITQDVAGDVTAERTKFNSLYLYTRISQSLYQLGQIPPGHAFCWAIIAHDTVVSIVKVTRTNLCIFFVIKYIIDCCWTYTGNRSIDTDVSTTSAELASYIANSYDVTSDAGDHSGITSGVGLCNILTNVGCYITTEFHSSGVIHVRISCCYAAKRYCQVGVSWISNISQIV